VIHFKQYGVQRSGTNYLKRLVELNFEDVVVFASILGWKHGMYETANSHADKFQSESHEDWIAKKTKGGKVHSVDNHILRQYTPEYLLNACQDLKYLISTKDPHAYIVSFKKFRARKQPWDEKKVKAWLNGYLESHKQWNKLYQDYPDQCCLIKYEDLLSDKDVVLKSIQTKFGLVQKHDKLLNEERICRASTDHGLMYNKSKFDPSYYLDKRYLDDMPENIRELVAQESKG
jgi:hypothetical protein